MIGVYQKKGCVPIGQSEILMCWASARLGQIGACLEKLAQCQSVPPVRLDFGACDHLQAEGVSEGYIEPGLLQPVDEPVPVESAFYDRLKIILVRFDKLDDARELIANLLLHKDGDPLIDHTHLGGSCA